MFADRREHIKIVNISVARSQSLSFDLVVQMLDLNYQATHYQLLCIMYPIQERLAQMKSNVRCQCRTYSRQNMVFWKLIIYLAPSSQTQIPNARYIHFIHWALLIFVRIVKVSIFEHSNLLHT